MNIYQIPYKHKSKELLNLLHYILNVTEKVLFYSISLIGCTDFYKLYLIGEILLKLNINYP